MTLDSETTIASCAEKTLQMDSLQRKLQLALQHTLNICVLGTDNRMKDIRRTGNWSTFCQNRYFYSGQYRKTAEHQYTAHDIAVNREFDSSREEFISPQKQWFYQTEDMTLKARFRMRIPGVSPWADETFCLKPELKALLQGCLLALEQRQGNCGLRAFLVAKYLWENNTGIHKIEVVEMINNDHAFVIVNRQGEINDPASWGDAWIVDAWYGEKGTIFHASDYSHKMEEMIPVMSKEMEDVANFLSRQPPASAEEKDKKEIQVTHTIFATPGIYPTYDAYPTYSLNPFYPIEYYYLTGNAYTSAEGRSPDSSLMVTANDLHRKTFKACLDEIQSQQSAPTTKIR